jgi:hypothetical protein
VGLLETSRQGAQRAESWILPKPVGDNLLLNAVSNAHDAERVAAFNASVHPDEAIGVFTRWKPGSTHPTVTYSDCLFVQDTQSSEIVSSLCLMPQTRTYEGVPLLVDEVSLVGTHPDYRHRGLIHAQLEAIDQIRPLRVSTVAWT